MKLSEVMTAEQWAQCLTAAAGNTEKAKVFAAIGWHETHFGRTPGYGQEGYVLGVGAYGGGQKQYRGLEAQLEWTAERLGSQSAYSLADLQWYGRNVQRPTQPDGTNTGDAWGSSVYSIYKSLVIDLPAGDVASADAGALAGDVGEMYVALPQWGRYLIVGMVGLLGYLLLPKGGSKDGKA